MNLGGAKTSRSFMVSQLVNKTMNSILDVLTCILLAGWLSGQSWIYMLFYEFTFVLLIYMEFMGLEGFGRVPGAWVPGILWRPVAGCGSLWRKGVAPIYYHARSLGLAGWKDGVWQAGWRADWMAGWWASQL